MHANFCSVNVKSIMRNNEQSKRLVHLSVINHEIMKSFASDLFSSLAKTCFNFILANHLNHTRAVITH